ncbi:hypothetical protein, partial [Aphanizomenon flos-aquae]|uniref:hypothetical protein n=1 Tax=Aphanizomenon flos-aquae TaxID=1176 RepID=UPI0005572897
TVNSGTEDDTITVGNDSNTVNNIAAALTISGDAGTDTMTVNDTGDSTANTGILTNNSLTGLGMTNGITYSNAETL